MTKLLTTTAALAALLASCAPHNMPCQDPHLGCDHIDPGGAGAGGADVGEADAGPGDTGDSTDGPGDSAGPSGDDPQ